MRHTNPIWLDPDQVTYPAVEEDCKAEVVVIGGGIAGISAARWLLADGVDDVIVLESRTISSGASGRNAGFVMAVSPENFPPDSSRSTLERARALWRFTDENQQLIKRTIDELDLDAEYRQAGSLGLAAQECEWQWVLTSTAIAREAGIEVQIVERSDLKTPWLREHYLGGAYYPGNGEINPAKFVRGVAGAIARRGVRIYERSVVAPIDLRRFQGRSHISLHVNSHYVAADKVVIATNAYTAHLLPEVGQNIEPIRGQVLATGPLSRRVAPCPVYANDGFQYWRQTASNRLVLGGWRDFDIASEVGTHEALNTKIQTELEKAARGIADEEVVVENRWSGTMGFTPDRIPVVGDISDIGEGAVAVCAGFNGHGLAMAVHSAKVAVDELLHHSVDAAYGFLSPSRFLTTEQSVEKPT